MALPKTVSVASAIVLLSGILYQFRLQGFIHTTLGIGRIIQPLTDFPYHCRQITLANSERKLEGCEDLWLDHERRQLYAACDPLHNRKMWTPALVSARYLVVSASSDTKPSGESFNSSGLKGTGAFLVLDIDDWGEEGPTSFRQMIPTGYSGVEGDVRLRRLGFDVEIVEEDTLRGFAVNHRVPVGLDPKKFGANSTIEVFEARHGTLELKHVKTVHDEAIITPNKVAATGDGGFVVTNDHSVKSKPLHPLPSCKRGHRLIRNSPSSWSCESPR